MSLSHSNHKPAENKLDVKPNSGSNAHYSPIKLHVAHVQQYQNHIGFAQNQPYCELIKRISYTGLPKNKIYGQQVFHTYSIGELVKDKINKRHISVFYPCKDTDDNDDYKNTIPLRTSLNIYKKACQECPELKSHTLAIVIQTTQHGRDHWLTLHITLDPSRPVGHMGAVRSVELVDSKNDRLARTYPTDYIAQAIQVLDPTAKLNTHHLDLHQNDIDSGPYARYISTHLALYDRPLAELNVMDTNYLRINDNERFEKANRSICRANTDTNEREIPIPSQATDTLSQNHPIEDYKDQTVDEMLDNNVLKEQVKALFRNDFWSDDKAYMFHLELVNFQPARLKEEIAGLTTSITDKFAMPLSKAEKIRLLQCAEELRSLTNEGLALAHDMNEFQSSENPKQKDVDKMIAKFNQRTLIFIKKIHAFEKDYAETAPQGWRNILIKTCAVLGAIIGLLVGITAGFYLGGLVGGATGSIVPVLGTIVGAVAAGSFSGVVGGLKGLGIGGGIGAAVGTALFGYGTHRLGVFGYKKLAPQNDYSRNLTTFSHYFKDLANEQLAKVKQVKLK